MRLIHLGNHADDYFEEITPLLDRFTSSDVEWERVDGHLEITSTEVEVDQVFIDDELETLTNKSRDGWDYTEGGLLGMPTLDTLLDDMPLSTINESLA